MMRVRVVASRGSCFRPVRPSQFSGSSTAGARSSAASIVAGHSHRPSSQPQQVRYRSTLLSGRPATRRSMHNNRNLVSSAPTTTSSRQQMSLMNTANILFAVAAMVSFRPLHSATFADARTVTTASSKQRDDDAAELTTTTERIKQGECPFYGCPLSPYDIVEVPPSDPLHNHKHDPQTPRALNGIRSQTRGELTSSGNSSTNPAGDSGEGITAGSSDWKTVLQLTGSDDMATMTMMGYKGGTTSTQINQDRAFAVGPYYISPPDDEGADTTPRKLMGVFDGHASLGEKVSQYVVTEFPIMLANKLRLALAKSDASGPVADELETTKQVLHETFVELDRTAPAEQSGGCTASVILQQGSHIYIANAGDSQSFVVLYRKHSQTANIVYMSREDKPDLPDERLRVEKAGGYVYVPMRGTSRVVYVDPRTGAQTGLAMSRSIGDWTFGKIGVIPDPIVDVLDMNDLVAKELAEPEDSDSECWMVDEDGVVSRSKASECAEYFYYYDKARDDESSHAKDDVYIFAVSATDGMMDYASAEGISKLVAKSLFEDDGPHPISACELLVTAAAQGWEKYKQGRYRDDIAVVISALRVPPSSTTSSTREEEGSQHSEL